MFDGGSVVCDETGRVMALGTQFEEDLVVVDVSLEPIFRNRLRDPRRRKEKYTATLRGEDVGRTTLGVHLGTERPPLQERAADVRLDPLAEVYNALVRGLKDYVGKNGFEHVVVAVSGGIDSALTAAVAVDALGPERVTAVTMPSRFSSDGTRSDAEELARNLGVRFIKLPIETIFEAFLGTLEDVFAGREPDIAEENIQARIRGSLVMALSNKFGWLVLTTGNKSEVSMGYATLYGDMAGGFAVLKDVYKTGVYDLSNWRNERDGRVVIPETTITRAPSAELRPDQKDEDSLPPYDVLDRILEAYVERDETVAEIVAAGFDEATVRSVMRSVDLSEYKRRQAPPGIKISQRAFGKDRRLPITMHRT